MLVWDRAVQLGKAWMKVKSQWSLRWSRLQSQIVLKSVWIKHWRTIWFHTRNPKTFSISTWLISRPLRMDWKSSQRLRQLKTRKTEESSTKIQNSISFEPNRKTWTIESSTQVDKLKLLCSKRIKCHYTLLSHRSLSRNQDLYLRYSSRSVDAANFNQITDCHADILN